MALGVVALGAMLVGMGLGLLIGAVLFRASVSLVRTIFGLGQPKQQATASWSNQQSYGSSDPAMPAGAPYSPEANPYAAQANPYTIAPGSPPVQANLPAQFEVLPSPTFGKAMLIIFLLLIVNFVMGLVIQVIVASLDFDPGLMLFLQGGSYLINAATFVVATKYLLPTTFLYSIAVLIAYTLICIIIGVVVFALMVVPIMFMG